MATPLVLLKASSYTSGTWLDESSNGKHATLETGTAAKNAAGNGIVLNGSTSWTIPNVAAANAWTASVWYKDTGTASGGLGKAILTQIWPGSGPFNMFIGNGGSLPFYGAFYNGSVWSEGQKFTLGSTWTNIQVTWNGTNLITYINGVLFGSVAPGTTSLNNGLAYRIGNRFDGLNGYVTGEIGEVRIYNFPLTQAQVTADYQASLPTFYPTLFSPTTIPGCQVWLDANDPNSNGTSGTNGSALSTWYDKSGNSRNMTLTGTGVTYANGYQNSLNAISLNGTAISGKVIVPAGTFSSNYTGFAVYRNTTNTSHVMMARTTANGWGPFDMFSDQRYIAVSQGNRINTGVSSTPNIHQTMSLWNFGLNNYASTGGTGTYNEYYNGTAATFTGGQRTGINAADFTDSIYFVGRSGVASGISGHYCEILIYNTNLSESQRQQVEGYLATKWGIQSSLPSSHPYYSAPPTAAVVTTSSLTDTSFVASWTGGTGATSYTYTLNGFAVTPYTDNGISSKTATFTGLTPSTPYTLVVRATNTTGSTASATTSITTLIAPPTTLVISVSSVTNTSFVANWTGAVGATSYTYMLNGNAAVPSVNNGLSSKSITFTGLTASTQYTFVVTATNSTNSTSSVETTVTTLIPPPTTPVVSVIPRDTTATISWSGGATATSYTYAVTSNGIALTPTIVDDVLNQTATITGLTASTNYTVIVTAINGTGSTASASRAFLTLVAPPTRPLVTIGSITNTSFVATWTGGLRATSYTYTLNGNAAIPSVDNGLSGSATFSNLTESTTYTLIVIAENSTNATSSTSTSITTLIPPPTTPDGLTINSITDTSFVANWTGGDVATSYTYTLDGIATTPASDDIVNDTASFAGLIPNKTYVLIVTAVSPSGSTSSAPVNVTTLPPPPTAAVVTSNLVKDTSFSISWTGSEGASSYRYTLNGVLTIPSADNGLVSKTATFAGLNALTSYDVVVISRNGTANTNSQAINVQTMAPPPTMPTVTISSLTHLSFVASWTGGIGATSYSYSLNGSAVTPSTDAGLTSKTATFTGLTPSNTYSLVIAAINDTDTIYSSASSVTTLSPPLLVLLKASDYTSGAWLDQSTYLNNALIENGMIAKNATGNGIVLNGSTNWIFPNPHVGNAWTANVWVKYTGVGVGSNPAILTQLGEGLPNILIGLLNGYQAGFYNGNHGYQLGSTIALQNYKWTNIQATYDGTTISTYVNGILLGAVEVQGPAVDNGNAYRIGRRWDLPDYFVGEIGEVRIYNTPLTQVQVTADYESSVATFPDIPPPAVPIVTISNITGNSFTASWTGGSGADVYAYLLDGGLSAPSVDNSMTDKSVTFNALAPLTTYTLVVRATNSGGPTSSAPVSITTLAAPPSQFVAIDFSEWTINSFKVSWFGGEGASSYTYTLNEVAAIPTIDMALESNFVVFSGLSPSTSYRVVITATNANGSTSTPTDAPYYTYTETLLKPYEITATSVTTTSMTLTWLGGLGATSYEYTFLRTEDTPTVIDNGVSSKSITLTGLSPNKYYIILINAINSNAGVNEIPSATTNFGQWTLSPPPTKPILSAGPLTPYSLSVSWAGDNVSHDAYTYTLNGIETSGMLEGGGEAISMATFGDLTPSTTYSVVVTAFNRHGESVSSDPLSLTTLAPILPPTTPVVSVSTVTASSFTVSWTGGVGATSYAYTLNGVAVTPSTDNSINGQTATFTGLVALTNYYLIVTAINAGGSTSSTAVVITTLETPAPTTPESVAAIQASFSGASGPAAASAIEAAITANLAPETIVAAALGVAITSPTMFTALVSNPVFRGTTVSVPAAVANALYAAMTSTTIDRSLPLYVNFPAADGSVRPPMAGSNSKLAIDLTATGFFPFNGCTGYGIRVVNGEQYFITPTNQTGTLVVVGEQLTFTPDGSVPLTFTIADLDVVLMPYTPPPAIICFLGSAPVLTPSGYKRIDRLAVGDLVKTPTGTAIIEAIKKQLCEPSTHSNPYVIPEGKFGANRKLHISPRHKVSIDGKMIEARDLGLLQEEQPKAFIYYNLQITKSQNMIVAGVEVESLAPLVRVTITREAFDHIVKTKFGGKITSEIRSKCIFLADGRVSVPSIKQ